MKSFLLLFLASTQALAVTQEDVLPIFGCGTGCRVETEQLSLPNRMPDGWLKVKVRQRIWVQKCDRETTPVECVDEPASEQVPRCKTFGCLPTALKKGSLSARTQIDMMLGNRMSSTEKGTRWIRNMGRFMEIPL